MEDKVRYDGQYRTKNYIRPYLQCESKKSTEVFWHFFPNGWEFLVQILLAYYTFLSTLDYNFWFNYLQL